MKTIKSIFKIYGIDEVLLRNDKKIEIIILKRNQNMTMNRWINLINSIKYSYKKEVDFFLEKDANKIYKSLDGFKLIRVNEND